MRFIKPVRFEVFLVRLRADEFSGEVLICEIDEEYQITWHAPIELFIQTRNMAVIHGIGHDGDVVSKDLMQVGTKKQEYAIWDPVLSAADFERMIEKKILREKSKLADYQAEPDRFSFYRDYADGR